MREKLKDAKKDILTMTLYGILVSFICSALIVKNIFPIKTLAAINIIAAIIFALFAALFLFGITKEQKYKPIFRFPLDILMLIFAITLFSYFVLLLAVQFAESEDTAEFIFKGTLFFLSYLGFLCYRNTEKKQYLLYAIIYGLSVLASWVLESDAVLISCSEIISNITRNFFPPEAVTIAIRDFAIPIREAMLLFTIWDNYPRKQDPVLAQKQNTSKEHSVRRKPNTPKRRKRKK